MSLVKSFVCTRRWSKASNEIKPKGWSKLSDQDYKRGINNDFAAATSAPRSRGGAHGSFEDVCRDHDGVASKIIETSA
jgi:hypothetical protein